ncbi:secondary thiamine-phosphate synthase enzyme YjbQ [Cucumibacter marinus]|uniref:secondary thiamine-phosphate synthase enzyme YjbQ n=1 Tax=Cucumibacter marinus TaxID=1121252 RepID=UPI00048CF210|nr:secondary thiamine-phosphate synthase enzyme YjbQ [Cucumibacter marinus]
MAQREITVETNGQGLYEITGQINEFLLRRTHGPRLFVAFVKHTSCSLIIQENADPDVKADLQEFFSRIAPEGMDWLRHTAEGPDDMPAHIKAALMQPSVSIPVAEGRLQLGTWQGIYLFEHRSQPHSRTVVLHLTH